MEVVLITLAILGAYALGRQRSKGQYESLISSAITKKWFWKDGCIYLILPAAYADTPPENVHFEMPNITQMYEGEKPFTIEGENVVKLHDRTD